jgi:hypothetical protein
MAARKKNNDLTPEHIAAMTAGRLETLAVKAYLLALKEEHLPGRKRRSLESLRKQVAILESAIPQADDPIKQLQLVQTRRNIITELRERETENDIAALESKFVQYAKAYSTRKGIEYETWREMGVPPAVLIRAGIKR